jgi:hypothetical protein
MKIRYTGYATRRELAGLVWAKENGKAADVPRDLVIEVLTNPDFEVDADDPLCAWLDIPAAWAGELALAGVMTKEEVYALDETGLERLEQLLGEGNATLFGLVRLANDTHRRLKTIAADLNSTQEE